MDGLGAKGRKQVLKSKSNPKINFRKTCVSGWSNKNFWIGASGFARYIHRMTRNTFWTFISWMPAASSLISRISGRVERAEGKEDFRLLPFASL